MIFKKGHFDLCREAEAALLAGALISVKLFNGLVLCVDR